MANVADDSLACFQVLQQHYESSNCCVYVAQGASNRKRQLENIVVLCEEKTEMEGERQNNGRTGFFN